MIMTATFQGTQFGLKDMIKQGVWEQACHSSTWEAEVRGPEFMGILSYIVDHKAGLDCMRPCLKTTIKY